MKKIIALFVFMLAFGFGANAQQKAATKPAAATTTSTAAQNDQIVKQAAAKDVTALMEVVTLDNTSRENFMGLFEYKHRHLLQNLSEERKTELAKVIDAKIRATLSDDQYEKLSKSPAVLQKLTH